MSFVIGFSGKIGSGKTTVAKYISEKFNLLYIGFGDYVKHEAFLRKIKITRKNLQDLGQMMYEEDELEFCQNVLNFHKWDGSSNAVIDGIRHLKVNSTLKKLILPLPYYLIHVETSDASRKERIGLKDTSHLDSHPTEKAVQQNLALAADFVINGNESLEIIEKKVSELYTLLIKENL
jgi:dephospho-CoA kinase